MPRQDFYYTFDPEELFHFKHGFYNEIVPGGRMEWGKWTPSSVFRDPSAGGTRTNLSLEIKPTSATFRFAEPVTLEIGVKNHTPYELQVGNLSPAYGDLRFVIRKPGGQIVRYAPPLTKCRLTSQSLKGAETVAHVTSLAVGNTGFVFDTPGRYEITGVFPDPSTGLLVAATPVSVWVQYPQELDEEVARRVFTRDAALFLYMGGGDHLIRGKQAIEEVAADFSEHPFAAHANLVLGLNQLKPQKSIVKGEVRESRPEKAAAYLEAASQAARFPQVLKPRLEATLALCNPEAKSG